MTIPRLLAGIFRFQDYFEENRERFERLSVQGRSPEALFITCSDARVPPEMLARIEPGGLFVVRNVANIVPPYGAGQMSMGACIEYAVRHLCVKHVIICGHTDCGGIKALDTPADWRRESHIARWIDYACPAKTKVEASGTAEVERHLAIVRENVILQLEHLRTYDPVREGERAGSLALHAWVYHLESGVVEIHDRESGEWSRPALDK